MSYYQQYRPTQFPPVIKNLLIINALVYVAQLVLRQQFNITAWGELYPVMPEGLLRQLREIGNYVGFMPFQLVTYMFLHSPAEPFHLLFNMFILWSFGRHLEGYLGPKRFLMLYLTAGFATGLVHLGIQGFRCFQFNGMISDPSVIGSLAAAIRPALGATGAVMGVLAAFAFLFPNTEMFILFIPVPIKAKWYVLAIILFDLMGWLSYDGADLVARLAHVGGALAGAILVYFWNKTDRRRFY